MSCLSDAAQSPVSGQVVLQRPCAERSTRFFRNLQNFGKFFGYNANIHENNMVSKQNSARPYRPMSSYVTRVEMRRRYWKIFCCGKVDMDEEGAAFEVYSPRY